MLLCDINESNSFPFSGLKPLTLSWLNLLCTDWNFKPIAYDSGGLHDDLKST